MICKQIEEDSNAHSGFEARDKQTHGEGLAVERGAARAVGEEILGGAPFQREAGECGGGGGGGNDAEVRRAEQPGEDNAGEEGEAMIGVVGEGLPEVGADIVAPGEQLFDPVEHRLGRRRAPPTESTVQCLECGLGEGAGHSVAVLGRVELVIRMDAIPGVLLRDVVPEWKGGEDDGLRGECRLEGERTGTDNKDIPDDQVVDGLHEILIDVVVDLAEEVERTKIGLLTLGEDVEDGAVLAERFLYEAAEVEEILDVIVALFVAGAVRVVHFGVAHVYRVAASHMDRDVDLARGAD